MNESTHEDVMRDWARVVREHDWDAVGDYLHAGAVLEYPQSGERFDAGGKIAHSRSFFAPDFDAPDWRAPYRAAP